MRRIPQWASNELVAMLRTLGISQARFHHQGNWYHRLQSFPAAYCMRQPAGFVVFRSEKDFLQCDHLAFGKDVHTIRRTTIASMPGFIAVSPPLSNERWT